MRKMHSEVRKKKHFFSIWFELIGMEFIWISFSLCRAESRALPKWTNVLRFCFIYFFFYSKHFMSFDAKLQNALKKLNSRGKTTWAILFRNFSHKISNPPEHILYAFSAKKYISYHFGNGFKTHDYNSRNPNKNKGYERKMTGSTRILKGTRPYWIIVIMFLRDVSKYASIEFVLALQLLKRWSRLYQIISIYIYSCTMDTFNAQKNAMFA